MVWLGDYVSWGRTSAAAEPTLTELRSKTLEELESLWAHSVELSPPRGCYRGHVLRRIDHKTSRRALWRWSARIGFEWIPFGIDFDRRLWFFFTPRVALARFDMTTGPSRWRDTDAIGLSYGVSRLPHAIRSLLYDEVKSLSERWLLGIGGIDKGRGEGDHFFFAACRTDGSWLHARSGGV